MKNITTYLCLFFLVFCTACSSDDSSKRTYPKIGEEEKALLLGDWQLLSYSDSQGNLVDFKQNGILIYYYFIPNGVLEINNVSSKYDGLLTGRARYLIETIDVNYNFWRIEFKEEIEEQGEKLIFLGFMFDIQASQDQLILTNTEGGILTFKRSNKGDDIEYPAIAQHQKSLLYSNKWKLEAIYAFNGAMRSFDQEEEVIYYIGDTHVVISENEVDIADEFAALLEPRSIPCSYRYDFDWEKREVLHVEDLGGFRVEIEDEELTLTQKEGYLLRFSKK